MRILNSPLLVNCVSKFAEAPIAGSLLTLLGVKVHAAAEDIVDSFSAGVDDCCEDGPNVGLDAKFVDEPCSVCFPSPPPSCS